MTRVHRRTGQKRSSDPHDHDGLIAHTYLEPDNLEGETKWALESLTMYKA